MATSQNGWPASSDPRSINVQPFIVHDVSFPGGVKGGDVATVLRYIAEQFHLRVEALHSGWCWGYAYRSIRGRTSISNHGSATALDCNAPDHPLGTRHTFSPPQVAEIHRILDEVDNIVRWGGDYTGRPDEMHFEINAGPQAVARVAAKLNEEEDDLTDEQAKMLAELHNAIFGTNRDYGTGKSIYDLLIEKVGDTFEDGQKRIRKDLIALEEKLRKKGVID